MLWRGSQYELVGRRVRGLTGTLVNLGAPDRILRERLGSSPLRYLSADVVPGHGLRWDLERGLEVAAGAFEVVVALDELQQLEGIHGALRELLRVARRKVFVSLPNMTCLAFRLHFLRHGQLSAGYALRPDPTADRHRWITSYRQVRAVVEHVAREQACEVRQYDVIRGSGGWHRVVARLPLPRALRTYTLLFELTKPGS